jgi:hypothetical protein
VHFWKQWGAPGCRLWRRPRVLPPLRKQWPPLRKQWPRLRMQWLRLCMQWLRRRPRLR